MTSRAELFEQRLLERGRREGRPGGLGPEEVRAQLGLDREAAGRVLRSMAQRGWYRSADDAWDGALTAEAPAPGTGFGSFAQDGSWSEDRWGHRIFHPRSPRPLGQGPGPTPGSEPPSEED